MAREVGREPRNKEISPVPALSRRPLTSEQTPIAPLRKVGSKATAAGTDQATSPAIAPLRDGRSKLRSSHIETPSEHSTVHDFPTERGEGMDRNSDFEAGDSHSSDWRDDWENAAYPDWEGIVPGPDDEIEDIDDNNLVVDADESPRNGSGGDDPTGVIREKLIPALTADAADQSPPLDADAKPKDAPGPEEDPKKPHTDRPSMRPGDRRETSPLLEAAIRISKRRPGERQLLKERLAGFERLRGEEAKREAAQEIWTLAADIVARAVTAETHRTEIADALSTWAPGSDQAASSPDAIGEWHRDITQFIRELVKYVKDVPLELLAKIGEEMLLGMLFPGSHLIVPPTDLVEAIFTALTLWKMTEGDH
jgi:hypothetical protein